jgi:hypothetical protein
VTYGGPLAPAEILPSPRADFHSCPDAPFFLSVLPPYHSFGTEFSIDCELAKAVPTTDLRAVWVTSRNVPHH